MYLCFEIEIKPCNDTESYTTKDQTIPPRPRFYCWVLLFSAIRNAKGNFLLSFQCFCLLLPFCDNLSSHCLDGWAPILVPKTQSLRNLQIRWFFSDLFSSLAQTFAMNWSRGSRVQTELCGLELSVMGKSLLFSSLLLHFSILSLFPQLSAESFCARVCTVVLVTTSLDYNISAGQDGRCSGN